MKTVSALAAAEAVSEKYDIPLEELVDVLGNIPAVDPRGHWEIRIDPDKKWRYHCSECGKWTRKPKSYLPNYCSFCGADMRDTEAGHDV